nr:Gag-Pol polyprotein [Tanacetum cinerariifolium]
MKSCKETVKIRVCKGGAWERVDGALEYMPLNCVKRTLILPLLSSYSCLLEAVSERLEINANSRFMVTYNSDNDIVEDPQSDSPNRKSKQVVGSLKHKKPSVFGKVKRLASKDESSESDEESSESDEDEKTTPVENNNCKVDKFWSMPPLLKTPVIDIKKKELILIFYPKVEMSRDVLTVDSTMRIPLLYRGEYSEWVERFINYLEEQTDGEAMINSIKNGDQPLPRVTRVSIAGTTLNEQPPLKDKSMWSDQEKRIQKIDHLEISLLIQGLLNDIYSLIDSNKTTKDLWDALARHMLGSEYGEQDMKAAVLYEYETFKATEGELLLDTYIRYLQYATMMRQNKNLMDINIDALYNILKQNQGEVNDAIGSKKETVVVTSDPLALIAEKINVSRSKEKVVVSSHSEESKADDFSELKKITALLAKTFNRKKFYSKPTNNNLRTSSSSQ